MDGNAILVMLYQLVSHKGIHSKFAYMYRQSDKQVSRVYSHKTICRNASLYTDNASYINIYKYNYLSTKYKKERETYVFKTIGVLY